MRPIEPASMVHWAHVPTFTDAGALNRVSVDLDRLIDWADVVVIVRHMCTKAPISSSIRSTTRPAPQQRHARSCVSGLAGRRSDASADETAGGSHSSDCSEGSMNRVEHA